MGTQAVGEYYYSFFPFKLIETSQAIFTLIPRASVFCPITHFHAVYNSIEKKRHDVISKDQLA